MAGKVLVNLTTGMEDPEQVTLAFLVAGAALEQGKEVVIWTTKAPVPAVPRRRREALAVPDLHQRPQARRRGHGRQREHRRRDRNAAMGRRRYEGVELLSFGSTRRRAHRTCASDTRGRASRRSSSRWHAAGAPAACTSAPASGSSPRATHGAVR